MKLVQILNLITMKKQNSKKEVKEIFQDKVFHSLNQIKGGTELGSECGKEIKLGDPCLAVVCLPAPGGK